MINTASKWEFKFCKSKHRLLKFDSENSLDNMFFPFAVHRLKVNVGPRSA